MFGIPTRLVVTLAAAGVALSGCTSTGTTNAGGASSPTTGTAASTSQRTTTAPSAAKPSAAKGSSSTAALGDVKLGAIRVDAKLGTPSAVVTITNHSSKLSNYIVDLRITSADGKTQLDTAMVAEPRLSPGKTATREARFMTKQKLPKGAKLAVVGVARLVA